MAQTIRITITPEIEKALQVLKRATMGTLNTTELIKMAVGEVAKQKISPPSTKRDKNGRPSEDISPEELDKISARLFYEWAKEDGSLEEDNIAHPEKLKPYIPKPYVRTR